MWCGLNPKYRADELHAVLADAEPRIVTLSRKIDDRARDELLAAIGELRDRPIVVQGDSVLADRPKTTEMGERLDSHFEKIAAIVYTSGTTGRPKGAMLSHASIVHAALGYLERYRDGPQRTLNNLPINHVGCLVDLLSPAIAGGWSTIFRRQFDPLDTIRTLADERITFWGQVPAMFELVVRNGRFDNVAKAHLHYVAWGGAAISRGLLDWMAGLGVDLSTNYGLTESVGSVTMTWPDDSLDILAESVGRPVEPENFRIVDEKGAVINAASQPGEIQVRGTLLFSGYFRNPTETARALTSDGWLRTGDVAAFAPDGNVRLVGRNKEMYKSGGYNVYPREIEATIEAFPGVSLAAVVPTVDSLWGEVGSAYIVCDSGITGDAIRKFLQERLANYKIPKHFIFRSSLPLLPIGKVDKQALRRETNEDRCN